MAWEYENITVDFECFLLNWSARVNFDSKDADHYEKERIELLSLTVYDEDGKAFDAKPFLGAGPATIYRLEDCAMAAAREMHEAARNAKRDDAGFEKAEARND